MKKLFLTIPVLLVLCGCQLFLPAGEPPAGRITDNTPDTAITGAELKNNAVTLLTAFLLTHPEIRTVNATCVTAEAVLKEELAKDEPSVIISRRPCALLKTVKAKPALNCNPDKCKGCTKCMKLGCPAISMKDGKAVVDQTLCVGCGVCQQLCAFGALEGKEND